MSAQTPDVLSELGAPSKLESREAGVTDGLVRPRTESADSPSTIGALLRRSVARSPAAQAIATLAEVLNYDDLDARTAAFAAALVSIGVGKGTRIALLAPDGITWLVAFLAATRIGALAAAVSTLATAPELAHVIRHSDAQVLIGTRRFLKVDYAERLTAALPGLAAHREGPLHLREAPYLRSIWLDNADDVPWASSHAELLARPRPDREFISAIEAEVVPSDDAVIIYTSGSESLPKAVVHTHRSLVQQSKVLAEHFCMKPSDRLMPLLPLFWVGGLTMATEVLSTGGTLVYPKSPAMEDVIAAIEGLSVNRVNSWGPQLERVRGAVAARGIDLASIGGLDVQRTPDGAPIPPDLCANMLGMTESYGPHSSEPLGTRLPEHRRGSSGRVTNDFERRVVDPETGEVLGPGRSGELQLRRGSVMRGFYKVDPDRVFTPDGFYPTGDTVRIEADGYLFFESRRKDIFKTAGSNVSRLEVEAAFRKLPDVARPIVVGLPDAAVGQIVAAAVVPAPGQSPTQESLQAALRPLLASYKVPRHIVFITEEEVPWTPSHKVRLNDVAKLIGERIAGRTNNEEKSR